MTKLKLLPFLLTCCLSINAQSWEKVYQNDENGKPLFGDKVALIEAIRSGKDVKIMVKNGNFEYYTPAENIWIKNGTVTIVSNEELQEVEGWELSEDKLKLNLKQVQTQFLLQILSVHRWIVLQCSMKIWVKNL